MGGTLGNGKGPNARPGAFLSGDSRTNPKVRSRQAAGELAYGPLGVRMAKKERRADARRFRFSVWRGRYAASLAAVVDADSGEAAAAASSFAASAILGNEAS